jgi:hypothetical protein
MKLLIFIIATFFAINAAISQKKNIKIPDSLHSKEIRITKSEYWAKTDILRIFFDQNSELKYELYKKDKQDSIELIDTKVLSGKEGFDQKFWLKVLMTDIHHIADYKDVQYKFKKNNQLVRIKNSWFISNDQSVIMDGVEYQIEINGEEKYNTVSYSNPDSYFKLYSEVDELKSVTDLLSLIRDEFGIWKK